MFLCNTSLCALSCVRFLYVLFFGEQMHLITCGMCVHKRRFMCMHCRDFLCACVFLLNKFMQGHNLHMISIWNMHVYRSHV